MTARREVCACARCCCLLASASSLHKSETFWDRSLMMALWLPSMLPAAAPLPSSLARRIAAAAAACRLFTSAVFSCVCRAIASKCWLECNHLTSVLGLICRLASADLRVHAVKLLHLQIYRRSCSLTYSRRDDVLPCNGFKAISAHTSRKEGNRKHLELQDQIVNQLVHSQVSP